MVGHGSKIFDNIFFENHLVLVNQFNLVNFTFHLTKNIIGGSGDSLPRSCKRSQTLFKSLLFWLTGEVSLLAVEGRSKVIKDQFAFVFNREKEG